MSLSVGRYGYGYAVFEGGRPITGALNSVPNAEYRRDQIKAQREKADRSRMRKCLCCPKEFLSEGPHHRMCNSCRQRSA